MTQLLRKRVRKKLLHEVKMALMMVLWPALWVCMILMMNNTVGGPGVVLALGLFASDGLMMIRGR